MKSLILGFVALGALVQVSAVEAQLVEVAQVRTNCSEFSDSARYNNTLQKCVLPFFSLCDESWPVDRQQCGAGKGGACAEGRCYCPVTDYQAIPSMSDENLQSGPSVTWSVDRFLDYSCVPRASLGESCTINNVQAYAFGRHNCQPALECANSTCVCEGDWDAHALVCRNDEYCSRPPSADGLHYTWVDSFYEKPTTQCTCRIGGRCEEHSVRNPGLCPLNAEMETDGKGVKRCECGQGFTYMRLDHDLRKRDPSIPGTVCVPAGRPGQPCDIFWQEAGTCLPSLSCLGEKGKRECECDGEWSEEDGYCFGDRTCSESLSLGVRDEPTKNVFYRKGSMQCTCGLGAPCPWATATAGGALPRVTCPRNSSLAPANDDYPQPACMCDGELAHSNGGKECAPKPRYGDKCENLPKGSRPVNPCVDGVTCGYQKCQCTYGKIWIVARGRCLPYWNEVCKPEEGCAGGAECATSGKCACLAGFYEDRIRIGGREILGCRLEGDLGARCVSDTDCRYFTQCVAKGNNRNGECTCRGAWNETEAVCRNDAYCRALIGNGGIYDSEAGLCQCLVGATCSPGAVQPENCPYGALPTEAGNSCECKAGQTPFEEGRLCLRKHVHGEKCEVEDPPDYMTTTKVHVSQCLNGSWCQGYVCNCHGATRWDDDLGWCVLKAGEICNEGRQDICTRNTKCLSGRCICPEAKGYNATPTGECLGVFGAVCQDNGNCARDFDCLDGKCACRSVAGQFYSPEGDTCVSLVGAHCDPYDTDGATATCAPGSTCDTTTRKCQCQGDKVPAQNNGRCFNSLKYGENCTENNCDLGKGLACDGDGRCQCADLDLVYHEGQGACLAPLSSRCGMYEVADSCLPAARGQRPDCEYYTLACEPGLECGAEGESDTKSCHKGTATVAGVSDSAPTSN